MNKKQSKKFLVIFLPIIALVVAIISIVGGVVASNKANPVLEVIGKEGVTTGESSEEEVVEEKTYTISGCTFSGTGTHLVVKSGTNYIVEDCTFSGKEGETSTGSAIKVEGGTLTLNNSTVENIDTTVNGAGINVASNGTLILNSSIIRNCKTTDQGGGIYSSGALIINGNTSLEYNVADMGGGIFALTNVTLGDSNNLWTGSINNNVAYMGGGIFIGSAEVLQYGGVITENNLNSVITTSFGAGVYIDGGKYSLRNTASITNNGLESSVDKINGSALYTYSATISFENNWSGEISGNRTLEEEYQIFLEGGTSSLNYNSQTEDVVLNNIYTRGTISLAYRSSDLEIKNSKIENSSKTAINLLSNENNQYMLASALTLTDSIIDGVSSTGDYGAIFVGTGASITLNNTIINNCSTTGSGGAIYSNGGSITLIDSSISNCSSVNGGAIYTGNDVSSQISYVNIYGNTNLTNNTATNNGGGVYVSSFYVVILGSKNNPWTGKISGNSAKSLGGGIYNKGEMFTQYGGEISENKLTDETISNRKGAGVYSAVTNPYQLYGDAIVKNNNIVGYEASFGGGVYVEKGSLELHDNASIEGNISLNDGGGIYSNDVINLYNDASVKNNTSLNNGGGICTNNSIDLGTKDDSWTGEISGNTAAYRGGGVFISKSDSSLVLNQYSGTISANKLTDESTKMGAGVYIDGTYNMYLDASVENHNIENFESNLGGGIFAGSNATINMYDNSTITNNSALKSGGSIFSSGGKLNFGSNSNVWNGKVSGLGGVNVKGKGIYSSGIIDCVNSGENATVEYVYETGNQFIVNKGTLKLKDLLILNANDSGLRINSGNVTITGGKITGCKTSNHGGGIYIASDATVVLNDVNITKNTSTTVGGGICSYGTLTLNGGTCVSYNESTGHGGGIIASKSLTINSSSGIFNNTSSSMGGGIYLISGNLNINNSASIYDNTASGDAGGLFVSGTVNFGSQNSKWNGRISGNSAQSRGGGMYINNNSVVNQYGGTISGNKLTHESNKMGAGIYLNSTYNMYDATISGHNIDGYVAQMGGGIYAGSTSSIINMDTSSVISENNVLNAGGGIFSAGTIESYGTIQSCSAVVRGGGIYSSGTVMLEGSTTSIEDCSSGEFGGGLFMETDSLLTIKSTAGFINCSSNYGGAICINSSNVNNSITDTTFENNKAIDRGGAVAVANGAYVSILGYFINTDGEVNADFGGAIYSGPESTVNVGSGSAFENLKAKSSGGAITNTGTMNIYGIFTNCSALMGGAIGNAVYDSDESTFGVTIVQASLNLYDCKFDNNTATEGESNAIVNIGYLYICGGIEQVQYNQDISLARVKTYLYGNIQGKISAAYSSYGPIVLSFADATLSSLEPLNYSLNVSGTESQTYASVPTNITYNIYTKY